MSFVQTARRHGKVGKSEGFFIYLAIIVTFQVSDWDGPFFSGIKDDLAFRKYQPHALYALGNLARSLKQQLWTLKDSLYHLGTNPTSKSQP